MIHSALRSALRTAARSSRSYSSTTSPAARSALVAFSTAVAFATGYALTQRPLEAKSSSMSVLDQPNLKEKIHKPEADRPKSVAPLQVDESPAPDVVITKEEEVHDPAQGAFNEETGEINWDCPCLGGMADGPCGPQFKAAFSCFVYSEAEPKGMDCVEKFKGMQDCFREHPDIYGEEIDDDEQSHPSSDSSDSIPDDTPAPRPPIHHPPENSTVPAQTPETNPTKSTAKIVPSSRTV